MLANKNTHEKKKSQLRFDVGNGCILGGVVLLGGGLAVAGLVAAFTIIKSRNGVRDDRKNENPAVAAAYEKIHDGTQGLGSVLENPTTAVHQNSCYPNHETPIVGVTESHVDSQESHDITVVSNLVQGDEPVPVMDGEEEDVTSHYQQEIVFSDDLNKETIEPCNEILNNEETSLPAPENIVKKDSRENLQLIENIEMKKEDEAAETEKFAVADDLSMQSEQTEEKEDDDDGDGSEEHVMDKEEVNSEGENAPEENLSIQQVEENDEEEEERYEEDENLPIQSVKKEGDNKDDDEVYDDKHANYASSQEDVIDKEEEESSEGTGSSSRESNIEAIWPTDVIEVLSHELKVMNANDQNLVEKMAKTEGDFSNSKSENGSKIETTENEMILKKKAPQELALAKVETIHLPTRLEVCVWSLMALILLLLLLHIRDASPLQDLSYENSATDPRV